MSVLCGGYWSVLDSIDSRIQLEEKVESALSKALEHSLRNCTISYGATEDGKTEKEKLYTIFRHQLIHRHYILSLQDFINLRFDFNCERDTYTEQPINFDFRVNDFVEVSEAEATALFKLAAMQQIL